MQCFFVGYRGKCQAKIQVTSGMFHGIPEKALLYYFIPYLNRRETYVNFRKSSEISVIFREVWKRFKPVFEELKRLMNFRNSLEVFGNFWKTSETVQKDFKTFGKSSGVFGKFRKMWEAVQKCF